MSFWVKLLILWVCSVSSKPKRSHNRNYCVSVTQDSNMSQMSNPILYKNRGPRIWKHSGFHRQTDNQYWRSWFGWKFRNQKPHQAYFKGNQKTLTSVVKNKNTLHHGCVKSTVIERRQHQLGRMADFPPPVTFSVFDL